MTARATALLPQHGRFVREAAPAAERGVVRRALPQERELLIRRAARPGEIGLDSSATSADRVIVNPAGFATLGPLGAALWAVSLGQSGIRPIGKKTGLVLFERADECKAVGAGFLLQPSGMSVLKELGILDEVLAHLGDAVGGRAHGFRRVQRGQ